MLGDEISNSGRRLRRELCVVAVAVAYVHPAPLGQVVVERGVRMPRGGGQLFVTLAKLSISAVARVTEDQPLVEERAEDLRVEPAVVHPPVGRNRHEHFPVSSVDRVPFAGEDRHRDDPRLV